MQFSNLLSLAATVSIAAAQHKGFNYGSTLTDGSAKTQADFEAEFAAAKALPGTSGFTSARLYTTIQAGTDSTPISAIPAAIAQDTTLLLGLWASGGDAGYTNEVNAILSAISTYGTAFTSRVIGISVGSEDLYRTSTIGIASMAGVGTSPDVLVKYINQLKTALASTTLSSASITHVDTYNAWTNSSNAAVISAVDFISMDVYPYFQKEMANSIENGGSLFNTAYDETVAVAGGKEVWVTETGWPVSGDNQGAAVASVANAKTYWDEVGCNTLFGKVNTFWYILQDALPTLPSPSFGLVGAGSVTQAPLFNLTCPAPQASSSSAAMASSARPSSTSSAGTGLGNAILPVAVSSASAVQSSASAAAGRPVFSTATMSSRAVSAAGPVVTSVAPSSGTPIGTSSVRTTARTTTSAAGGGAAAGAAQTSAAASASVPVSTSGASANVLPIASTLLCMVAMFMTI